MQCLFDGPCFPLATVVHLQIYGFISAGLLIDNTEHLHD